MLDKKFLYELPYILENYPYLNWTIDSRLRRYIDLKIPANSTAAMVVVVTRELVTNLKKFPSLEVEAKTKVKAAESKSIYNPENLYCHHAIVALLAHILFDRRSKISVRYLKNNLLEPLQFHFQEIEISEIYQISLGVIADSQKFLHNFQGTINNWNWERSLCEYTYSKFRRSVVDELRKLPGAKDFKRTNLGLLNRASSTKVRKALTKDGEREENRLVGLQLLHECFQEVVAAEQFKTNNPTNTDYNNLLARYRQRAPEFAANTNVDRTIEILTYLGNTIRNYEQPPVYSSDTPVSADNGDGEVTFQDLQADDRQENILPEYAEMRSLVEKLLADIPDAKISICIYGLNMTQSETGKAINRNQSTVKRHCDRTIAKIARQLHIAYHPNVPQISTEELKEYSSYIETCCEDYYSQLLQSVLAKIAEETGSTNENDRSRTDLTNLFAKEIEQTWQLPIQGNSNLLDLVDRRIAEKVK
jgi:DNA-directed RNA polymerase specialized sigma24 family protein